jgi:hypothetical protein
MKFLVSNTEVCHLFLQSRDVKGLLLNYTVFLIEGARKLLTSQGFVSHAMNTQRSGDIFGILVFNNEFLEFG